jgi:hypothetical protein
MQNKKHTLTFTQDEVNFLSQVVGFVDNKDIAGSVLQKLGRCTDEKVIDSMYEEVYLLQTEIPEQSVILPKELISMYANGFVLKLEK